MTQPADGWMTNPADLETISGLGPYAPQSSFFSFALTP